MEQNSQSSNKKRILFIDLLRALAVVMMVEGHTVDLLLADSYRAYDSLYYNLWNFVRGFTAPIFLFSTGTVFAYLFYSAKRPFARNPRVIKGIKRFFLLLGLGYLLRWPAPHLSSIGEVTASQWQGFFTVDILQLIAVGLLLIMVLAFLSEALAVRPMLIFAPCAFIIFAAHPIVANIDWKAFLPIPIAGYFYQGTGSLFPLTPWAGFVVCGAVAGTYLADNPAAFRNIRFSYALFLLGLSFAALSFIGDRIEMFICTESALGARSPNLSIFRLGMVLLLNSIISFVAIKIENMPPLIIQVGRNSLFVYIVHLVILYGSPWSAGLNGSLARKLNLPTTILATAVMLSSMVAMVYSIYVIKGYFRRRKFAHE